MKGKAIKEDEESRSNLLMNTTVNCSFFVSGKFKLHVRIKVCLDENFAIPNQKIDPDSSLNNFDHKNCLLGSQMSKWPLFHWFYFLDICFLPYAIIVITIASGQFDVRCLSTILSLELRFQIPKKVMVQNLKLADQE